MTENDEMEQRLAAEASSFLEQRAHAVSRQPQKGLPRRTPPRHPAPEPVVVRLKKENF